MATLVLTAVGTAVGGPIGAAVGGLLGGAIDRAVLAPRGREGPRLTDLKLQTSSYGTPIPLIFGTLRVAGTVIWATDLIEHRERQGGGKGQPTATAYSYSASFAVALSGRPMRAVRRIWAEGKLLRGAAGDWKTELGGFRLHPGGEDQAVDPLIAAREGTVLAPAHRGVAYAVFEDLALGDFGNRIPSLTFEVEADAAAVAAGTLLAEASGGLVADDGGAGPLLAGFAAHGDAGALAEQLAELGGAPLVPDGGGLRLAASVAPVAELADAGVATGLRGGATGERRLGAGDALPRRITVAHYDPARDWQTGSQSVGRPGGGGRERRIELPVALDAGAAKTLAAGLLARGEAERVRRTLLPGWDALAVRPGDAVRIAGEAGTWRVRGWSLERMAPALDLVPVTAAPLALPASAGRFAGAADRMHGATTLHAFEVPGWPDAPVDRPQLLVAAAGTEPGWRRAALLLSTDGGGSWRAAGGTAAPAVMGTLVAPLAAGDPALIDRSGAIEVDLLHEGMTLEGATGQRVDAGANLALLGDELVQFEGAEPVGARRWRLTGLWRGRRGTAAAAVPAGVRFVVIEAGALATVALDPATRGTVVRLLASGPGDAMPAEAAVALTGSALVPPAPVFARAVPEGDGMRLRWTRRSRAGWRWLDGADVPLGEAAERYRVEATTGDGTVTWEVAEASALLPAGTLTAAVRQIGDHGAGAPMMWGVE